MVSNMSKLDELIQKFCPSGVDYLPLGDVVTFLNGRAYKQSELLNSGKYRVLRVGNFYTSDKWYYSDLELEDNKYCNKGDLLYSWAASLGPKIWDGDRVIFHYHIWKLVFDENVLNKHFLYHFLLKDIDDISSSLTNSTMPHVSMSSMVKRYIPVPPLPVQEEIVRILDKFTELTAELQANLADELTARKQQYEYYRDELLAFGDDVERKPLNSICDIKGRIGFRGYTKNDFVEAGKGAITLSPANIENQHLTYKDPKYISLDKYEESPEIKVELYDLLLCKTGSTVGKVCIVDTIIDKTTINPQLVVLKNIICNKKYLYYQLTTYVVQSRIKELSGIGSVPNISQENLGSIEIPIPLLPEQERIVALLDRFDVLCNDITAGLPAEIAARQQQYEYYRDKLLTFKRKEVV